MADETAASRLGVLRSGVRHLRAGGALLTFPAGRIEPDPAVLPGAAASLEQWSASLALFARLVPDATIVPAIVSGVLSRAALRNPLIYIRRREQDRQWLAATLQVGLKHYQDVRVRVAFGAPTAAAGEPLAAAAAVLATARGLVEGATA